MYTVKCNLLFFFLLLHMHYMIYFEHTHVSVHLWHTTCFKISFRMHAYIYIYIIEMYSLETEVILCTCGCVHVSVQMLHVRPEQWPNKSLKVLVHESNHSFLRPGTHRSSSSSRLPQNPFVEMFVDRTSTKDIP